MKLCSDFCKNEIYGHQIMCKDCKKWANQVSKEVLKKEEHKEIYIKLYTLGR
jgi:hypothetical protein